MIKTICPKCGKIFFVYPSRLRRKCNVYCSAICSFKGRQNDNFKCISCGKIKRFYLGKATKYCSQECFKLHYKAENHHSWKGNKAVYNTQHSWIRRVKDKANHCIHCGLNKIPKGKKRYFHWANVSGKYRRDISDYISLCVKCHKRFDG